MLIVVEFIVFVVSSGLFCSSKFRHQMWAVIVAGGLAVGSSLLFAYGVYERLTVPTDAPVKVVKEVVPVPVVLRVSRPPSLARPQSCRDDYPLLSRIFGDEGTTEVAIRVLADGTVSDAKVAVTSGSSRLDDAAVDCVSAWHYRPAIKDDQTVDAALTVKVVWNLDEPDDESGKPPAAP